MRVHAGFHLLRWEQNMYERGMGVFDVSGCVMNCVLLGISWLDQWDFETGAHRGSESAGGPVRWTGASSSALWVNAQLYYITFATNTRLLIN